MKNKGVKIALIIILVILSIALITFMIIKLINKDMKFNLSLIGFGDKTEMLFQEEYEIEPLESIYVDVSSSNVRIEKTDTDKIKVTAYGDKGDTIQAVMNENELSITKQNTNIYLFTVFYWCREEIIIEIPNESDESFKIHTSSGDIITPNLENNQIQFETGSGDITCGNLYNGDLKSSSGDISIGDGNEITLNSSSGKIKTGNVNILNAKASSGDIEIGTIEEGKVETSSGKITVEGAKRLQAQCSSGKMNITHIENYCELSTSSGNIEIQSLNITKNSTISAKSGNVDIRK